MAKQLVELRRVDFELRAEASQGGKLAGRAVVYDSETVIGGMFREVFRAGAFTKTLRESKNIVALWNHNDMYVLGSTRGGTLELRDTDGGLEFEIDPPTKSPYDGFRENIQRGDVSQMSFRFLVVKEEVSEAEAEGDGEGEGEARGLPLRAVTEARLIEISPVTFPAYEDTEVEARAAEVVAGWKDAAGPAALHKEAAPAALHEEGLQGGQPRVAGVPGNSEDGDGEGRTTPEPGASAAHSVEPDGLVPEYILTRCKLDAAQERLIHDEREAEEAI